MAPHDTGVSRSTTAPHNPDHLTALILAGGRSTRFGSEKALHRWRGASLIEHVLTALNAGVQPVSTLIAIGAEEAHPELAELLRARPERLRFLADSPGLVGPLAGLAAGLEQANSEWVVACACDMPALTPRLLRGLVSIARQSVDAAAVAPVVDGRFEPLCALYRPEFCREALEEYAQTGRRSLQGLLAALSEVRTVGEGELEALEPEWRRALANINRLDELERL